MKKRKSRLKKGKAVVDSESESDDGDGSSSYRSEDGKEDSESADDGGSPSSDNSHGRASAAAKTKQRKVDASLIYYAFNHVILRYANLKKSIKEANKSMKHCDGPDGSSSHSPRQADETKDIFSDHSENEKDQNGLAAKTIVDIVDAEDIEEYKNELRH